MSSTILALQPWRFSSRQCWRIIPISPTLIHMLVLSFSGTGGGLLPTPPSPKLQSTSQSHPSFVPCSQAAASSLPGQVQGLTRSLGGISESRKSLLIMSNFFLRKATCFSDHTSEGTASLQSANLENLQRHVGSCSETSAGDC